jgi:hypothetical protein
MATGLHMRLTARLGADPDLLIGLPGEDQMGNR